MLLLGKHGENLMKAAEKTRQKLSSSQPKTPNAKYNSKRWKVNLSSLEEYLLYMSDESLDNILED